MRAVVMHAPGEPLRVEELELAPPGPGEVQVRVTAAGVCHSDLHYLRGDLPARMPLALGHEGTGVVEEVGAGVDHVSPGDTVVMTWRPRCGQCEFCASGRPGLCVKGAIHGQTNGLLRGGTRLSKDGETVHHLMGVSCFAEQTVVSQESVIPVPADIPPQVAAIVGCAVITGMGVVLNRMPSPAGKGVLVIGAGGVGLSSVIGARLVGANPVIVADIDDEKLTKARELGATHTVNSAQSDLVEAVRDVTGSGVHWAVEAIGRQATIEQAMASLRPGGTTFVAGLGAAGDQVTAPLNPMVQQEKSVQGSLYGSSNFTVQIPQLLDLYRAGRIALDSLLGREYRLDQAEEALAGLVGGPAGRSVILL